MNIQEFNNTVYNDSVAILNESLSIINTDRIDTDFRKSDVQSEISDELVLSEDLSCKSCYSCIQRAMQSHLMSSHIKESYLSPLNLDDSKKRIKRKTTLNTAQNITDKKSKKLKFKRNKTVSIIKYNNSGKIYALKVKEIQTNAPKNNSITTCQVYSIQKHFPCESPDADLLLTASKRKINKTSKKKRSKRQKNVSDTKTTVIAPAAAFRKSHVDSSQVPEQIMPSIEEIY